ncbi:hypothetical protein FQN57_002346 [Myotisia sp. PD_48]|nr:hypothetical protein FQN57_002346 [Myotisia sp. PD_48]
MTEPPAKRAKRTDSSAMWELNDKQPRSGDDEPNETENMTTRKIPGREDAARIGSSRGDRRARSRSRDRDYKRRERSRSRDRRTRDPPRESRRDIDRDGRNTRGRDRSLNHSSRTSRYPDRSISRSRSPARNGSKIRTRSPPPAPRTDRKESKYSRRQDHGNEPNGSVAGSTRHGAKSNLPDEMELDPNVDPDDLESVMMKTMGFSSFRSTQNTKIPGNNAYGVRREKKTEYRQYMNRVKGFNRPLSPSR